MKKWLDGNRDSHPEREIVELVTGASLVNGKLVTSPGITQADAARQLGLHPDQVKRVVQKLRQHIARRLSND